MFLVDHGTWKHKKHKEFVTGAQVFAIVYKHKFHAFWSSPSEGAPMCLDQLASASKIYCVIFLSSISILLMLAICLWLVVCQHFDANLLLAALLHPLHHCWYLWRSLMCQGSPCDLVLHFGYSIICRTCGHFPHVPGWIMAHGSIRNIRNLCPL